jgi:putative addiction module CopG family antidote
VDIPEDVIRFAELQVAAGRFASVDDVVRAAGIEALRRSAVRQELKSAWLDQALAEGEASGLAEDGVFERIFEKFRLAL